MCIYNIERIVDTDHLIGYKVISVNKHGTKLPIFKLPMLYCKTHPGEQGSIKAFYEWYAPLVGKEVGYFI